MMPPVEWSRWVYELDLLAPARAVAEKLAAIPVGARRRVYGQTCRGAPLALYVLRDGGPSPAGALSVGSFGRGAAADSVALALLTTLERHYMPPGKACGLSSEEIKRAARRVVLERAVPQPSRAIKHVRSQGGFASAVRGPA